MFGLLHRDNLCAVEPTEWVLYLYPMMEAEPAVETLLTNKRDEGKWPKICVS
jgi:hypothetical protein